MYLTVRLIFFFSCLRTKLTSLWRTFCHSCPSCSFKSLDFVSLLTTDTGGYCTSHLTLRKSIILTFNTFCEKCETNRIEALLIQICIWYLRRIMEETFSPYLNNSAYIPIRGFSALEILLCNRNIPLEADLFLAV